MLRLSAYGFAKRVDNTVGCAMTILHTREDFTERRSGFTPAAGPGKVRLTDADRAEPSGFG